MVSFQLFFFSLCVAVAPVEDFQESVFILFPASGFRAPEGSAQCVHQASDQLDAGVAISRPGAAVHVHDPGAVCPAESAGSASARLPFLSLNCHWPPNLTPHLPPSSPPRRAFHWWLCRRLGHALSLLLSFFLSFFLSCFHFQLGFFEILGDSWGFLGILGDSLMNLSQLFIYNRLGWKLGTGGSAGFLRILWGFSEMPLRCL